MRFTVEQYHRMIESGIVPEDHRYELIHGYILPKDRSHAGDDPMTVGRLHRIALDRLMALRTMLDGKHAHLSVQQPVAFPDHSEPEPDAAIVRGQAEDYDPHPTADHVLCVIEVSDSSLHHDRVTKAGLYASAGIKQYVIVNLVDGVVEVRTQPSPSERRYDAVAVLRGGQSLALQLPQGMLKVAVADLLP